MGPRRGAEDRVLPDQSGGPQQLGCTGDAFILAASQACQQQAAAPVCKRSGCNIKPRLTKLLARWGDDDRWHGRVASGAAERSVCGLSGL